MRKMALAAFAVVAIASLTPAPLQAGKPSGGATITFYQYGAPVTQVRANDPFEVRGNGLRPSYAVLVCFSGDHCLHSDADAYGSFTQSRSIGDAGAYTVTVQQSRNRQMGTWMLKASATLTVAN